VVIDKKKIEESAEMKYQKEISTNPRLLHRKGWYLGKPKSFSHWELKGHGKKSGTLFVGCEIAEMNHRVRIQKFIFCETRHKEKFTGRGGRHHGDSHTHEFAGQRTRPKKSAFEW
jgi:hypothetical protein